MPDEPNVVTQPDPNAPPGNEPVTGQPGQPPKPPDTVPVGTLVQERRQWQGRVASLEQRIHELEAKPKEPVKAGTPSEEDELVEKWQQRLRLKEPLSKLQALEMEVAELKKLVPMGQQAHATLIAQQTRAMDKAEKIADESIDKDLERIGFTKDTWSAYIASQLSDDDVAELFASPSHMNDIVKRCKQVYMPQINLSKANEANKVRTLPKAPGPGGTPPGPPQDERLKVGKALHARAFGRLQDTMKVEGG